MAATDAVPVPVKNTAYRITFAIYDVDGDLVASAAGLDSEVSIDGAAFSDCTNEATEIAQGFYYLDLTAGEMNGDTIAIIVKTSTTDAKPTAVVLYPTTLSIEQDVYQARVWMVDDNTGGSDLYTAIWYKNGVPVESGVTFPTIRVIDVSDWSDLVGEASMLQDGTSGRLKYTESTDRIISGQSYIVEVQATIDGAERTWHEVVGRDS